MRKTKDTIKNIEEELNKDIYNMDEVESLNENDMISPAEAGFMKGYLGA